MKKYILGVVAIVAVLIIGIALGQGFNSKEDAAKSSSETSKAHSANSKSEKNEDVDTNDETESASELDADFSSLPLGVDFNAKEATKNIKNITYAHLLKSDKYFGKSYSLKNVTVAQAFEEDGETALLVSLDEFGSDLIAVHYSGKNDIIEGNIVNIDGVLGNRVEYDTQAGGNNLVPTLEAKNIKVLK